MEKKIRKIIEESLKNLGIDQVDFIVEHPANIKMGDYSTNVAMVCAKNLKKNPKELAEEIKSALVSRVPLDIERVEVAGAGFINFFLALSVFTDGVKEILEKGDKFGKNDLLKEQKIMVEYTDPNPFKPFHIGHLMTNAIGEAIARVYENSGAQVYRANYQGDVGLHVARAIYGMYKAGPPADEHASPAVLASYIGDSYAKGSDAYENDPEAKKEIDILNKKVYDRSDAEVNKIYDWGKEVTLGAFEEIYKILGTKFDHYFFESMMSEAGLEIVKENTPKVFTESEGAIVFKAEEHNPKLHTRVFVTSAGLPTYETKELGLTKAKFEKEDLDKSIVITAHEQGDYMKVVACALSLISPEYEKKMQHITHGMMRFVGGKMSSRKGNVITGESLLRDTITTINEKLKEREWSDEDKSGVAEVVGVASIKYSILRSKIGGDIVFDIEKSISTEGDSGPYLQYALTRAKSVLEKANAEGIKPSLGEGIDNVLSKMLVRYPEVAERAYLELEPHHIVTYLTELASLFNSFYAEGKIVDKDDINSPARLALTQAFTEVMHNGLYLLGIKVPTKM